MRDALLHNSDEDVVVCPTCGRCYVVDYSEEEIDNLIKWSNREMLIQDALPNRNKYERELIRYAWGGMPMISCCEECYKEKWGDIE